MSSVNIRALMREKLFLSIANNNHPDTLVHPVRLISSFAIFSLECIISTHAYFVFNNSRIQSEALVIDKSNFTGCPSVQGNCTRGSGQDFSHQCANIVSLGGQYQYF